MCFTFILLINQNTQSNIITKKVQNCPSKVTLHETTHHMSPETKYAEKKNLQNFGMATKSYASCSLFSKSSGFQRVKSRED